MEKPCLREQKLKNSWKKELVSHVGTKKNAETTNIYLKKLIKNLKNFYFSKKFKKNENIIK